MRMEETQFSVKSPRLCFVGGEPPLLSAGKPEKPAPINLQDQKMKERRTNSPITMKMKGSLVEKEMID
jgi:hypothetical protein